MPAKRRRGRPELEPAQRRNARIVARVRASEKADVERAAAQAGLDVSDWLRDVALRAARRAAK